MWDELLYVLLNRRSSKHNTNKNLKTQHNNVMNYKNCTSIIFFYHAVYSFDSVYCFISLFLLCDCLFSTIGSRTGISPSIFLYKASSFLWLDFIEIGCLGHERRILQLTVRIHCRGFSEFEPICPTSKLVGTSFPGRPSRLLVVIGRCGLNSFL